MIFGKKNELVMADTNLNIKNILIKNIIKKFLSILTKRTISKKLCAMCRFHFISTNNSDAAKWHHLKSRSWTNWFTIDGKITTTTIFWFDPTGFYRYYLWKIKTI